MNDQPTQTPLIQRFVIQNEVGESMKTRADFLKAAFHDRLTIVAHPGYLNGIQNAPGVLSAYQHGMNTHGTLNSDGILVVRITIDPRYTDPGDAFDAILFHMQDITATEPPEPIPWQGKNESQNQTDGLTIDVNGLLGLLFKLTPVKNPLNFDKLIPTPDEDGEVR